MRKMCIRDRREDIRKLDQRIEQAEFIFQHHVEDRGQLASLRQQAEDEIAVLLKQRQKLYRLSLIHI